MSSVAAGFSLRRYKRDAVLPILKNFLNQVLWDTQKISVSRQIFCYKAGVITAVMVK